MKTPAEQRDGRPRHPVGGHVMQYHELAKEVFRLRARLARALDPTQATPAQDAEAEVMRRPGYDASYRQWPAYRRMREERES